MENLEQRISLLEAELQGVVHQNRRLRVFMPLTLVVASLPFVLGWARMQNGVFDVVQAKQFQIKNSTGKTTVLIGTSSTGLSSASGGFIHVTDAAGQVVGQLDGFTNNGGTLKLLEAGTGNSSANTGLVHLAVEQFRSSPARGVIKLYSVNRGRVALRMEAGPESLGEISIENPPRGSLIRIGADSNRNGVISVRDRDGRSECLLEAMAATPLSLSSRSTVQSKRTTAAPFTVSTTGGGGRFTLKGPDGKVTFKAPGNTTTP